MPDTPRTLHDVASPANPVFAETAPRPVTRVKRSLAVVFPGSDHVEYLRSKVHG